MQARNVLDSDIAPSGTLHYVIIDQISWCETQYIISITMHSFCTRHHGWQTCTMAIALESAAKSSNDQWVCNEVPDDVIQNDKLYYKFIATVTADLTKLPCYFNKHIADEVSLPFFHCCHLEKNNKICIFCGLLDKELTK